MVAETVARFLAWAALGTLVLSIIVWRVLRKRRGAGWILLGSLIGIGGLVFIVRGAYVVVVHEEGGDLRASRMRLLYATHYKLSDGTERNIETSVRYQVINDSSRPVILKSINYSRSGVVPSGGGRTIAPKAAQESSGPIDYLGPSDPPPSSMQGSGFSTSRNWLTW